MEFTVSLELNSLEGCDDAGDLRDGAAAGHGGQGSRLLHRGADQPNVSFVQALRNIWFLGCVKSEVV